jgi:hypothetical protein
MYSEKRLRKLKTVQYSRLLDTGKIHKIKELINIFKKFRQFQFMKQLNVVFFISNFRRVLYVVCFLLGDSQTPRNHPEENIQINVVFCPSISYLET